MLTRILSAQVVGIHLLSEKAMCSGASGVRAASTETPFLKTPGIDYKTKTCQVNTNHRRQHVHKVAQINKTYSTTPGLRSAPKKRCKTFIKWKRWCVEHPALVTRVLQLWQLRRPFSVLFLKNFR